jgi:hypothetical protein
VASVAARRSTWTAWNVWAEAERLLHAAVRGLDPGRHRDLADAITAVVISSRYSISVEAPALLDNVVDIILPLLAGTTVLSGIPDERKTH